MKMFWLPVAVVLLLGLVWSATCHKPDVNTVSKVKKTIPRYIVNPGTKKGDFCINPKDGAKMVWIPAGYFLMGSNSANKSVNTNETPQRKVYLDGYWMNKYEVTVAQYHKFCLETLRPIEKKNTWGYIRGKPSWGWIDNHPIVNVSWQDATAYAKWAGGSLPTEAQWEKAARGTDGREYPWGNQWDASKCNGYTKRTKKTQSVGSYPLGASPYGCMDMAGNVMEWCADWFGQTYYNSAPSRNPTGPSKSGIGAYRVQRGGSWFITIYYLRCASRSFDDPDRGEEYYGFRLAR